MLLKYTLSIVLALITVIGCDQDVKVKELPIPQQGCSSVRFDKFGMNTANLLLYYPGLSDTAQVIAGITLQANVRMVRFPGGTTANFYHPNEKGYGYRAEDVKLLNESPLKEHMSEVIEQAKRLEKTRSDRENYILPFSKWAKANQLKVMYVANLLSGSVEETMMALATMKEHGVEVIGVELGNEYYLNAYSAAIPSVMDYTKRATEFASEIRKAYPKLRISAVAAPSSAVKQLSDRERAWNQHLHAERFYDAVSMHFYPLGVDGSMTKPTDNCSMNEAVGMARIAFTKAIEEYQQTFADVPIWLSEWNVMGAPKWCANTPEHNIFILEMLALIECEPMIEWACYHTLLSRNDGFNIVSTDKYHNLNRNYSYWPFHFQSLIKAHFDKNSVAVHVRAQNGVTICDYSNDSGDVIATSLWNTSINDEKVERPKAGPSSHLMVDENGFQMEVNKIYSSEHLTVKSGTTHLFLVKN